MKILSFSKLFRTIHFILILVLSALSQEDKTYEEPNQIIFIRSSLSLGFSSFENIKIGLGPYIEFGTTINKHIFGINGIINLRKHSYKRFIIAGGGLNWQYRFIIRPEIFEFSPGLTCGFWRKDTDAYFSFSGIGSKSWYHWRDYNFVGPKVQMKAGYRHFFFTVEYIGLIGEHYLNIINSGFEFDI